MAEDEDPEIMAVLAWLAGQDANLTTQSKEAFRRFKGQLHEEHPGLLSAWYASRDARLRGNALCRISQAASAETPASSADLIRVTSRSSGATPGRGAPG